MPEGFSSIADMKIEIDATTEKLSSGLDNAIGLIQRFKSQGDESLGGFDKVLDLAAGGVGKLRLGLGQLGLALGVAETAIGVFKQQGQQLADALGAGEQFAELSDEIDGLVDSLGVALSGSLGKVKAEAAETLSAMAGFGGGVATVEAQTGSLAQTIITKASEALKDLQVRLRSFGRDGEKDVEQLGAEIDLLSSRIATMAQQIENLRSGAGQIFDPLGILDKGGSAEAIEAKMRALEFDRMRLQMMMAIQAIADEAIAREEHEAEVAERQAAAGETVYLSLAKQVEALTLKASTLGMTAAEAAAFTAEQNAMNAAFAAGVTPGEDMIATIRAYAAKIGALTQRLADFAKAEAAARQAEGRESAVKRIIEGLDSRVEAEERRLRALGMSTAEAERLAFAEQALDQIRRAGRDPTEAEVALVNDKAAAYASARQAAEQARQAMQEIDQITGVVTRNLETAFQQWTNGAEVNVRDMVGAILRDLAMLEFRSGLQGLSGVISQAFAPGAASGSGGLAGSILSSVLSGAREMGGPVQAGKAYLVGEKRPEVFVPSVDGNIRPSADGASGGGEIVVTVRAGPQFAVDVESAAEGVVARRAPEIVGASVQSTKRALPGMLREAKKRSL